MRTILVLLRKDLAHFTRDRASFSLTFLVPFVLIWIFGFVFGVNRSSTGPSGIALAVVNQSDSPAARALVAALEAEPTFRVVTTTTAPAPDIPPAPTSSSVATGVSSASTASTASATSSPAAPSIARALTEAEVRAGLRGNAYRFALILPPDFLSADRFGARLRFLTNPRNDIETQTVNGILQKTIFSQVPEILGQSLQNQAREALGDPGLRRFNTAIADAVATSFDLERNEVLRGLEAGDFGLGLTAPTPAASAPAHSATAGTASATPSDVSSSPASSAAAVASSAAATPRADIFSQLVQLDTEQVTGAQVKSPAATRLVGGWAIQFLLFAVAGSATALFHERDQGLFIRLLSLPVTRAHILWSKFAFGVLLGLVQLVVLFLAGQVLYGVDALGHLPLLALVSVFAAAACTSFGLLLAAVVRTPQAASGLATFLILTMSAIGGAWFPPSFMPEVIQFIGKFTLIHWSMEGFSQVLWAGASFVELLPVLGVLGFITALVMGVALWRFRRGDIFG